MSNPRIIPRLSPTLRIGKIMLDHMVSRYAYELLQRKGAFQTILKNHFIACRTPIQGHRQVEQGFRTIKTVLWVRPIYIVRYVEVKTGQSCEQIARLFRRLHVTELITDAGIVFRRSELSEEHKAILKALRIPFPRKSRTLT